MKQSMRAFALIVTSVAMLAGRTALAQRGSIAAGGEFDYTRSNLVPGCSCFSLYGGSGQVQFGLSQHISLLGDVAFARQSGLTQDGYSLTESTYVGGVRVYPMASARKLRLFGDATLGLAHTGGTLAPGRTGFGSSNALAVEAGGGAELRLGRHFLLVPAQADYLLTTFSNGANNRQNQLRLGAGLLYRWKN